MTDLIDKVARVICRERNAYMGEPPCYAPAGDDLEGVWPNPCCREPGCFAFATAAIAAVREADADELDRLRAEVNAWRERFPVCGFDGNSIVLSG